MIKGKCIAFGLICHLLGLSTIANSAQPIFNIDSPLNGEVSVSTNVPGTTFPLANIAILGRPDIVFSGRALGFSLASGQTVTLPFLGASGEGTFLKTCMGRGVGCQQDNVAVNNYYYAVGQAAGDAIPSTAQIYRSLDGGRVWEAPRVFPESNTSTIFNAVGCNAPGQACIAAGSAGDGVPYTPYLYRTSNQGGTWTQITPPNMNDYDSIQLRGVSNESGHGIIVGSATDTTNTNLPAAVAYYTADSGELMGPVVISTTNSPVMLAVSCNAAGINCVAVGAYDVADPTYIGPVAITQTSGATWTEIANGPRLPDGYTGPGTIYGVSCSENGLSCVAVGSALAGGILTRPVTSYSRDGGENWSIAQDLPLPDGKYLLGQLQSVSCDGSGQRCTAVGLATGFAVPSLSLIYRTSDGGVSWRRDEPAQVDAGQLTGVICTKNAGHCVAVGGSAEESSGYVSLDAAWFSAGTMRTANLFTSGRSLGVGGTHGSGSS